MAVAPFPTLARPVTRITTELWVALRDPARGALVSAEIAPGAHVIEARDAIVHAGELLELWLDAPELAPDDIRIGLQLYVDGALWTGGTCARFERLSGWAALGESVLDGTPASIAIADDVVLRTRIEGASVIVWDPGALARGDRRALWTIRCEREALARAIAAAGTTIDTLRRRLIEAIEARFDRRALPARIPSELEAPRAWERLDKAALLDREIARRFDPLGLRELAGRVGRPPT